MAKPQGGDLSGGEISETENIRFEDELKEESQRRRWKSVAFWGVAFLIIIFLLIFFGFLDKLYLHYPANNIEPGNLIILGVLGAIPSLLIINFLKMVSKPPPSKDPESFDFHPLVALLKDFLEALKKGS